MASLWLRVSHNVSTARVRCGELRELEGKCQICLGEAGKPPSCKPADPSFCQCYRCSGAGLATVCQTAPEFEGDKIYSCPGYRLPTETEWEYAYRAGTTTALYSGPLSTCQDADDPSADAAAWYKRNAYLNIGPQLFIPLHPGGEKAPNAWGLHDMAGNLLEWVHSAHADYLNAQEVTNPDPSESEAHPLMRVLRGGWYDSLAADLRGAARAWDYPTTAQPHRGFRCARTLY